MNHPGREEWRLPWWWFCFPLWLFQVTGFGREFLGMASKTNPFTFLQQVRQEVAKVTWPTRRETMVTTIMVFIMILLAAFFFLAVDQVLSTVVGLLLEVGS